MKQKCRVIGVSRYSFPNETTGEIIKGCKVIVQSDIANSADFIGADVVKMSGPLAIFPKFQAAISKGMPLPGDFELDLNFKTVANKPIISVLDVVG